MTWVVVDDPIPAGASHLGTGLGARQPDRTARRQRDEAAQPRPSSSAASTPTAPTTTSSAKGASSPSTPSASTRAAASRCRRRASRRCTRPRCSARSRMPVVEVAAVSAAPRSRAQGVSGGRMRALSPGVVRLGVDCRRDRRLPRRDTARRRFDERARRLLPVRCAPARSPRRRAARAARRPDAPAAGLDAARRRVAGARRGGAAPPRIAASSLTAASTGAPCAPPLWQRLRGGALRGASTMTMQVAALLDPDLRRAARRARWPRSGARCAPPGRSSALVKDADPRGLPEPRDLSRRAAGRRRRGAGAVRQGSRTG